MTINIVLSQSFKCEAKTVLNALSDHSRLDRFFNASFRVLPSPAQYTRRQVTMLGYRFIEHVELIEPFSLIYHIAGKGPVDKHSASIHITPSRQGCHLVYSIHCQAKWWQPSRLVKAIITQDLTRALCKLKELCDAC